MDKISIELARQDAKALLLLADSMNFYAIGAALSQHEDFDETQIHTVYHALGHLCLSISDALSSTPEATT